ncbi:MAG: hypothetical protein A2X46_18025 [Lentisphaerae bacterium GWF2_57_35]|nr:MAG: hypothetical protein A2X46_18025 [Lentisphaerae bacterium GWF2_57_35]
MTPLKSKLHHNTPGWVPDVAIFHIRIRCASNNQLPLTHDELGLKLLSSIHYYANRQLWSCYLFVLMPDHVHALLSFDHTKGMSQTVRNWKRYHASHHGVLWQENFFDHRIRSEQEFSEKYAYIERNPVAKNLCATPEEWPWKISSWEPDAYIRF